MTRRSLCALHMMLLLVALAIILFGARAAYAQGCGVEDVACRLVRLEVRMDAMGDQYKFLGALILGDLGATVALFRRKVAG